MNQYLSFAILFCLSLLQSTVMPRITLLGVHPDLVLMAVISWSLLRGSEEGMLWALIGGVIMDLLSGAPFGICTLALLIASFASGLGQHHIMRADLLIPVIVIPPATLVYHLILLGALAALGWRAEWNTSLRRVVLPSMLINSLGMPVVYLLVRWLHRRMSREEIAL
jgi:rod shape-determining protein MreD